jgi:prepilin-type processing-associated H-X9-DG protein
MRRVVTIAVLALGVFVLGGLLVSLLGRSHASAERTRCQDNLRRICQQYLLVEANDKKQFPAGTIVVADLPPEKRLSWLASGLTRLGHANVAETMNFQAAWDADTNRSAAQTFLPHLACPAVVSARPTDGSAPLFYPGIAGVGPDAARQPPIAPGAGMFRYDSPTLVADVKDGLSNTLLLIETSDRPGAWIAGGPTSVRPLDPANQPYLGRGRPFGGCHLGGANAAFADGSGRFITDEISPNILERLATIADGKPTDSQ